MLLTTLLTASMAGTLDADLGGETPGISDDVVVRTYQKSPIQADFAASLYVQIEDEPVACQMAVSVRPTGEIAHVSGVDCPNSLLSSAREGLLRWGYHPPTRGDQAVSATHEVTLEYRARQVATAAVYERDDYVIVPVAPAAIPRWPVSPEETRAAQRAVDRMGRDEVRCTFGVSLKDSGALDELQVLDCPPSLGEQVERQAKRWGFDVEGEALAMTEQRFRMEMVFSGSE